MKNTIDEKKGYKVPCQEILDGEALIKRVEKKKTQYENILDQNAQKLKDYDRIVKEIKRLMKEKEWISVDKKLPMEHAIVLTAQEKDENQINKDYIHIQVNPFILKYWKEIGITHWMPLSNPPKDK